MKKTWLVLFLFVLVFGCQNTNNIKSIENFIPENSNLIIEIKNFERFKSALKNNSILSETLLDSLFTKQLGPIDSLKITGPLLLCSNLSDTPPRFTLITEKKDVQLDNFKSNYYLSKDSILVISNNLTETPKPSKINHPFVKYRQLSDPNSTLSIFNKTNDDSVWNNVFLNVNASPESVTLNGVLLNYNNSNSIESILEQNPTKSQKIVDIVPENVNSFEGLNLVSANVFLDNLRSKDSTLISSEFSQSFFGTLKEIGWIKTPEGTGFAAHSLDTKATSNALIGFQSILETYRSVPIFEFNRSNFLRNTIGSLFEIIYPSQYIILDDFFIFSDNPTFLKKLISDYKTKNTLANNKGYIDLTNTLSDEASFQSTFDNNTLKALLNSLLQTNFNSNDLKAYQYSTYQLIKDDEVTHLNARIQKEKPNGKSKKVREEFSLKLDADILGDVQFVDNHYNQQKDIIVQDVENHLYLISNRGVVQWKKRLSGPILGRIQQVDLYKNGRLQLVFSTPKRLYVLDRLGRDVADFPLEFKDNITQPLAVFDYDNSRNYRFLITQDNALLMYDGNGKRVKGFKYKPKNKIENTPKHIRYRGKDYIVFNQGKTLNILNRRGDIRVPVVENINFSDQNIFFYKNQFSTLNNNGDLVQVDIKGRVSRQSLGFASTTTITASTKTLVAQWDNHLQIKDNKIELDFGRMTAPQLFYLKDRLYITLTDKDARKVWFYNSSGEILSGFPAFGSSKIDLSNADNDGALEFICQSGSDEIIMYQLY